VRSEPQGSPEDEPTERVGSSSGEPWGSERTSDLIIKVPGTRPMVAPSQQSSFRQTPQGLGY